jgi:hypothetical protein
MRKSNQAAPEQTQGAEKIQDSQTESKKEEKEKQKPKDVTESQQSGTSSLLETSEDEEQKKKDTQAKANVKLTERQLAEEINIFVSEQNTTTLFHIPSAIFPAVEKLPKEEEEIQDKLLKETE